MADADETLLRGSFDRLRSWLQERHCDVAFYAKLDQRESALAGLFKCFAPLPSERVPPKICIYRDESWDNAGPARHELITLAHESGHWRSWKLGKRPETYDAANDDLERWPNLSADEKTMIYEEELRAWCYGQDLLKEVVGELPEDFWADFDERKREALVIYRQKLVL